ncbi:MAG: amidase [Bosea sp. (in: a-proteobacteria)]|uniref:amidase n=1 Tax=Bosea sp. (in: a-proteobacteria) TaxID=1871050 RepID=UPI0027324038|nr:amidase [Bosea sp. (in: a-proteobacteria)]MDP3257245.1 amidase [Bosea sp. (in: a-proteobacteria)]MDP3317831.1 amidase [Bosea sp. (in: a-proteobacteria)]
MSSPADLSAAELLDAYRARTLSPVEAVAAVITRIEQWEPRISALYAYDPEAAMRAAKESEARWMKGEPLPLDGVPGTIKENIATKGTPMPIGTAARDLSPMVEDAPVAARLGEAGFVMVAKTTMPDYGMLSSGLSSFHDLARNPWDITKNSGGSSAGAGAAGAAGYGPLHVGTDIGGSIRLPAGWCGLVGLKPSFGRVPIDPSYYGRVAGPMTRTVTDAALMMREIAKPDARDGMSLPPQEIDWLSLDLDVKGLRIGLQLDPGIGIPVEPETKAAIEAAGKAFAAAGAIVEKAPAFMTRAMLDGLDDFWSQRAWADIGALSPDKQAKVLPYIFAWAKRGDGLSGERVYRGMSQMLAIKDAALRQSAPFDFVLSPVAPVPSYAAELASPLHDPDRPFEHIVFTLPANMSDQPSIAVPAAMTAGGLPIGLQITGRRFDDLGVLRLARAWERLRPPLPAYPAAAG